MGRIGATKILYSILKSAFASALMGIVCHYLSVSDIWASSGHTLEKARIVATGIFAGIATYAVVLYLLKSEELTFILNTMKLKLKK
jgi:hypothetical protein